MPIIKCKMCGGDIELSADKTFGTCDYCGSTMTLPKVDDDQRAAAFNRGNHFRRIGEFDKALAVYERIVAEDDTDAEAHWCCALCRFGIEYVEDPNTYEYLPTCHRASFDSFLEDVDYLSAVEHSDGITKRQYQKEAVKIAEVQKGILATSQNEEPFDVFICYKETDDATKERTHDSIDAQEIYYQLTQAGYRVFFSRITLEDKAGAEYEPYIFAALNSAKVMVAVGSKPEYFNAVWVKNEWSRFLALMRKDRSKLLLPCYKDMDPYDLPEQLSVLQSYDMTKIGFMQDLIWGIRKILNKDEPQPAVKKTLVTNGGSAFDVASLLKRTALFLEDKNWSRAHELCDQVLNADPENVQAYVYELMVDLQVSTQADLVNCSQPFEENGNYQKAIRFASPELKAELKGYLDTIKERNVTERKNKTYFDALKTLNSSTSESSYREAARLFQSIPGWKDSDEKQKEACRKADVAKKDSIYQQAKGLSARSDSKSLADAIKKFGSIPGWKDAESQVAELTLRFEEAQKKEELEEQERLRIAELQRQYDAKYSHLINSKKQNEERLNNVQDKIIKLQDQKTGVSSFLIGFGIFTISLAIILIICDAVSFISLANLFFGVLELLGGIYAKTTRSKNMAKLSKEKAEIANKLNEIRNIPSFKQFVASIKKTNEQKEE